MHFCGVISNTNTFTESFIKRCLLVQTLLLYGKDTRSQNRRQTIINFKSERNFHQWYVGYTYLVTLLSLPQLRNVGPASRNVDQCHVT